MNEEENTNLKGKIDYLSLREIIFDYFKKTKGIELKSISIDYLRSKFNGETDTKPFFIRDDGFGKASFDISKGDIEKIFKIYLASKGIELTSGLEPNGYDEITFIYNKNPNIKNEMTKHDNEFDLSYNCSINYTDLREIIFDYYKKTKGIELKSISIDYLKDKLVGNNNYDQPFFIRYDGTEEIRFDISKEEIQEILKSYLASRGFELTELKFADSVEFKYKDAKKNEQANLVQMSEPDKSKSTSSLSLEEEASRLEPSKEPVPVRNAEIERFARERTKFTILQRERAMNEAQKGKNRSAIMAGLCILSAIGAMYLRNQNVHQILQHELNAIYSWEALGQYIQGIGPLTTLLAVGAGGFIARYFRHSKKFKEAQHEFEDFNSSLENPYVEDLGGNENVKAR